MSTDPPSGLGDPRTDDGALGLLLATAHQRCRQALGESLRPLGIETRHLGVLAALERPSPASQRHLSRILGLDKSAMVRIMDELERLGLASRHRAAHDRRAHAIEPTPQGRHRARTAGNIAAAAGDELFGRLRPAERDQLVTLLSRLAERTPS